MPTKASCGNNHRASMGVMGPAGWFWRWWAWAIRSLLDSTRAETAMLRALRIWPRPILWRGVGEWLVSFFHNGHKIRSMRVREMAVEMNAMTKMEPAGILKWGPRWRSMVRAWRTVRLLWIPIGVDKNILVHQSGKILIRVLRSSTCWTVHNLHGFAIKPSALLSPSVFSAARFRNLHEIDEYITN